MFLPIFLLNREEEAVWRFIQPTFIPQVPAKHCQVPGTVLGTEGTAVTSRESLYPFLMEFSFSFGGVE